LPWKFVRGAAQATFCQEKAASHVLVGLPDKTGPILDGHAYMSGMHEIECVWTIHPIRLDIINVKTDVWRYPTWLYRTEVIPDDFGLGILVPNCSTPDVLVTKQGGRE
jgi:hypothetical protein